MQRILVGILTIMALVFMISCENSAPTAPESGSTDASLGKGKGGGAASASTSGETAYTCTDDGIEAGLVGECPSVMSFEYTLWAGKHNDAGTVKIWSDGTDLFVEYNTNETADLKEAHVYVWTDASQIPEKRPAPGQAPYTAENINADSYTFVIEGMGACGDEVYVAAHAALTAEAGAEAGSGNDGETAYGGGDPSCFDGQKGAWWGYATFSVDCYYEVSGTVYEDANNNGQMDAGEEVFAGISVTAGGESTTTDANGNYAFMLLGGADYLVSSASPAGDYLANEGAGGIQLNGLSACLENQNFGFVPLYDLSVSVSFDGDMDCFGYSTVTINGDEISSLENQLPGFEYVVVVTAYDLDGNVLASETVSGALNEDTELTLSLGGWVCPVDPPTDCNECLDGELVANGSFEDGMNGWSHSGVSGMGGNSIDLGNWAGAASDGNWVIDLVGTGTPAQGMQPGVVEQTLCTEPGEEYVLTFDVKTNGSAALLVTIDGNSQTFSSNGSYSSYSVTFTASSSATTIRLAADASWHYLYNNVFLDNVSIACGGGDDFPTWGQDISHVVLAFQNADGDFYLIKIDEYPDAGDDDLDNDIEDYLSQLSAMGAIPAGYELIGSSIKGGRQVTSFYNYGSYNTNGDAADTPPAGFPLTYNGTSDNEGNQNLIDATYDWILFQ